MATQESNSQIATAGTLLKTDWGDYPTPQEYANAVAEVLQISVEGGAPGQPGEPGAPGSDAPAKEYDLLEVARVSIPLGVQQVNAGVELKGKYIQIEAADGQETTPEEVFAVGVIEGTTAHFVFNDEHADTPTVKRDGWSLVVYEFQEVV